MTKTLMRLVPRLSFVFLILFLSFCIVLPVYAKKSPKQANGFINPRIQSMSTEDRELFDSLPKNQQKKLQSGKIEEGYNAWMAKIALGDPYYTSEHHPVYVDYEEVWLYAKPEIEKDVDEKKITDPQTQWPTVYRKTTTKTCQIGDFFLLFDRGVIKKVIKDDSKKIYGNCVIETTEEFLPIVDGKPVERNPS